MCLINPKKKNKYVFYSTYIILLHSVARLNCFFFLCCALLPLALALALTASCWQFCNAAAAATRRRQVALANATQSQQRRKVCQQFSIAFIALTTSANNFYRTLATTHTHLQPVLCVFYVLHVGWCVGKECIKNANAAWNAQQPQMMRDTKIKIKIIK